MNHTITIKIADARTAEEVARVMRIQVNGWTGAISQFDEVQSVSVDGKLVNLENGAPVFMCSKCGMQPAEPDHTCPYATEINDDYETLCDCCAECEANCAEEI